MNRRHGRFAEISLPSCEGLPRLSRDLAEKINFLLARIYIFRNVAVEENVDVLGLLLIERRTNFSTLTMLHRRVSTMVERTRARVRIHCTQMRVHVATLYSPSVSTAFSRVIEKGIHGTVDTLAAAGWLVAGKTGD